MTSGPRPAALLAGVLLAALGGCSTLRYDLDTTELLPPAAARTVPPAALFHDLLAEVFTRRISEPLVAALYARVVETGTAWFEVGHDDHFHRYFAAYVDGPHVLVVGELSEDGEVTCLGTRHVPSPSPAPAPAAPPPGAPGGAGLASCPHCHAPTVAPGDRFCTTCGRPVSR